MKGFGFIKYDDIHAVFLSLAFYSFIKHESSGLMIFDCWLLEGITFKRF